MTEGSAGNSRMKSAVGLTILWLAMFASGVALRRVIHPSNDAALTEAKSAIEQRDFDQAERTLRKILGTDPDNYQAGLMMGAVAFEQGDFQTAIAATYQIPDSFAEVARARTIEGDSWFNVNRTVLAEQHWLEAANRDDELMLPRLRLVRLYAAQQRRVAWARWLWDLYDHRYIQPTEMTELMVWSDQRWDASVVGLLEQWAQADPQDVHSRRSLALHLIDGGEFDGAISALVKLKARFPEERLVGLDLLRAHLLAGRLAEARSLKREIEQVLDDHYRYHELVGTLELQQGNVEASIRSLTRAARLSPLDLPTRQRLAEALRLTGVSQAADRQTSLVGKLLQIRRLCKQLQSTGLSPRIAREMIALCEQLQLDEEALGWAKLANDKWEMGNEFHARVTRLAEPPRTSSRNPSALLTSGL